MQVSQYNKHTHLQIISLYCRHNYNNNNNNKGRFVCLFVPISNLIQTSWSRAIQKISRATQKYVGNLKFPKNGFAWNFTYLPEQASSAKQTALLCLECFGIGVNSVAASVRVCMCMCVCVCVCLSALCLPVYVCECGGTEATGLPESMTWRRQVNAGTLVCACVCVCMYFSAVCSAANLDICPLDLEDCNWHMRDKLLNSD